MPRIAIWFIGIGVLLLLLAMMEPANSEECRNTRTQIVEASAVVGMSGWMNGQNRASALPSALMLNKPRCGWMPITLSRSGQITRHTGC